jgi:transposase
MISVEDRERIRRAYYLDHKSIRQVAREQGHSRKTVEKALSNEPSRPYQLTKARSSPVFGLFQGRADALLEENERLPRKQRYTAHKLFELLTAEGYAGSESRVRQYVSQWRSAHHAPKLFLPLEFEPGQDAQADWGEAIAVIGGVRQTVQVFVMRLNYSRRSFVMAFPSQNQESFFWGHVQAFQHFGGVPARISYDNLATAVQILTQGRVRREQRAFVAFRSHYLFESHFCTPAQGHEKGGVEHSVGFSRRNFLVPIPQAESFEALNQHLLTQCLRDDGRRVDRQPCTIGEAWQQEQPLLRTLPTFAYECCVTSTLHVNPYSQVTVDTNRYSVPTERARREVVVKAYPFHLDVLDQTTLLARHARCYGREQDLFNPLHYLSLLVQRPGALDYAKPLKNWRSAWPASYEQLLERLREQWPEGRGVREFVRILQLHQQHPATLIEAAIEQALAYGCVHFDGVWQCVQQQLAPERVASSLDLATHPHLAHIGTQPLDLHCYEQLLQAQW